MKLSIFSTTTGILLLVVACYGRIQAEMTDSGDKTEHHDVVADPPKSKETPVKIEAKVGDGKAGHAGKKMVLFGRAKPVAVGGHPPVGMEGNPPPGGRVPPGGVVPPGGSAPELDGSAVTEPGGLKFHRPGSMGGQGHPPPPGGPMPPSGGAPDGGVAPADGDVDIGGSSVTVPGDLKFHRSGEGHPPPPGGPMPPSGGAPDGGMAPPDGHLPGDEQVQQLKEQFHGAEMPDNLPQGPGARIIPVEGETAPPVTEPGNLKFPGRPKHVDMNGNPPPSGDGAPPGGQGPPEGDSPAGADNDHVPGDVGLPKDVKLPGRNKPADRDVPSSASVQGDGNSSDLCGGTTACGKNEDCIIASGKAVCACHTGHYRAYSGIYMSETGRCKQRKVCECN